MKVVAILCNVLLFAFTWLVYLTDGLPEGAAYVLFNAWLLGTLILNMLVILRHSASASVRLLAIGCNVVLLAFVSWALVDQHPHPQEEGLLAFVVLIVLTPILSVVVLIREASREGWLSVRMKSRAD